MNAKIPQAPTPPADLTRWHFDPTVERRVLSEMLAAWAFDAEEARALGEGATLSQDNLLRLVLLGSRLQKFATEELDDRFVMEGESPFKNLCYFDRKTGRLKFNYEELYLPAIVAHTLARGAAGDPFLFTSRMVLIHLGVSGGRETQTGQTETPQGDVGVYVVKIGENLWLEGDARFPIGLSEHSTLHSQRASALEAATERLEERRDIEGVDGEIGEPAAERWREELSYGDGLRPVDMKAIEESCWQSFESLALANPDEQGNITITGATIHLPDVVVTDITMGGASLLPPEQEPYEESEDDEPPVYARTTPYEALRELADARRFIEATLRNPNTGWTAYGHTTRDARYRVEQFIGYLDIIAEIGSLWRRGELRELDEYPDRDGMPYTPEQNTLYFRAIDEVRNLMHRIRNDLEYNPPPPTRGRPDPWPREGQHPYLLTEPRNDRRWIIYIPTDLDETTLDAIGPITSVLANFISDIGSFQWRDDQPASTGTSTPEPSVDSSE